MGHKGDEAALILQGACRIDLGDKEYELSEGDSIYITEETPHRITNIGNVPLTIISAISPPGRRQDRQVFSPPFGPFISCYDPDDKDTCERISMGLIRGKIGHLLSNKLDNI